ncbi:MAG: dTDP-4-dehydrorhamnose reductase [Acidobacteriota bacterium]
MTTSSPHGDAASIARATPPRALIFGATGMLGRDVTRHWRRRGGTVLALDRARADLRDAAALERWAQAFRPEVIVNCAAFTRVDDCETQEELATEINGAAVAHALSAARAVEARLVHVSTDYVFDGSASAPIPEDALTSPASAYGRSKLRGEHEALADPRSLVVRTSWLFGPDGPSFVATMTRLVHQGRTPLRVVDDQRGLPTYTRFLARALADLAIVGAAGIVHYGNRDAVTWHGFTQEIVRHLDPTVEVLPVSTSEFPRPAARPAYSVFDVSRCERLLGRPVETWRAGLRDHFDDLASPSMETSSR